MSAVEEYREQSSLTVCFTESVEGGTFTHEMEVVQKTTADAALAEETARADRAEALLRYVLMQDMEHGDRGREPLDGLIERLGAFMDAEVQP